MSTKVTRLNFVLSISGICVLWGAAASAEVVASVWARTSMSLRVDPWESQWDGCAGLTESYIDSAPNIGLEKDSQQESHGGDGVSLFSFIEQQNVRNMAQGSAEVTRVVDGYGKEAAIVAAEGRGELSGPNYYLGDFASAANYGDVIGGFVADHTSSPNLSVNCSWAADFAHAYAHAPEMPDWQTPEITIKLRIGFSGSGGSNLLTPQGPWQSAGEGYLENYISSQNPGFYESDSWLGNWRVNLVAGEAYAMYVESFVNVQSPGGYVPEPTTVAFLFFGGEMILSGRRKK